MTVDEFYFHRRRGLGTWERIGHPVDTASVLLCYLWLLVDSPVHFGWLPYFALTALSCLLITKDEWVHARACTATEHWLHAVLFVLHPVVLGAAAWVWLNQPLRSWILFGQAVLTVAFLAYQTVFWNFLWKPQVREA